MAQLSDLYPALVNRSLSEDGGLSNYDISATLLGLKVIPRTVLIIDECSTFAIAIQELAEKCKAEGVRMVMVGADRSSRLQHIRDRIVPSFLKLDPDQPYWCGKLSDADINRLIDKLHSRGRLGKITRWSRPEQQGYFTESSHRRLFDAMAELEGGIGFRERVRGVYLALTTDEIKSLYAGACISYDIGIPLPIGIAQEISGIAPKNLMAALDGEAKGVLVLTRSGIRTPHRITASMVVNYVLSRAAKYEATLSLLKGLAPHVDPDAMGRDTREYRIVRNLMDEAMVRRHVGADRARKWYDSLREWYDWNGRYWDQRALFESGFGEHRVARSYAERSLKVHEHPFAYNTLGTVLLHMAIQTGGEEALIQGIDNLEAARDFRRWEAREHPFVTFFSLVVQFSEEWGLAAVPQTVRSAWSQWFRLASSSPLFSHEDKRRQLEDYQRRWLRLSVGQG